MTSTPCAHVFHTACIDRVARSSDPRCPCCRTDLHTIAEPVLPEPSAPAVRAVPTLPMPVAPVTPVAQRQLDIDNRNIEVADLFAANSRDRKRLREVRAAEQESRQAATRARRLAYTEARAAETERRLRVQQAAAQELRAESGSSSARSSTPPRTGASA